MKTIIAIKGKAETGKSTTLKKVYELLKINYPNARIPHEEINNDIEAIIEIKGLKLGIVSAGDVPSDLMEILDWFVKEQCSIIVCATRTKQGTVKAVEKLESEYQFQIIWKPKSSEPDAAKHEQINNAFALEIFAEIKN